MKQCSVKIKVDGVYHVNREGGRVDQIKRKAGDTLATDGAHAEVLIEQGLAERVKTAAPEVAEAPPKKKARGAAPKNKSK